MSKNEDDDVGYKKPPKETQFKPGQSGNPKGRPKKVKDFDKLFDRELSQTIRISDGGQMLSLTKREVLVKGLVNDALKGERAAQKLVVNLMKSQHTIEAFEPDASDYAALMELFEKAKLEDEKPEEPLDG
jgi:hypothetical protein